MVGKGSKIYIDVVKKHYKGEKLYENRGLLGEVIYFSQDSDGYSYGIRYSSNEKSHQITYHSLTPLKENNLVIFSKMSNNGYRRYFYLFPTVK